MSSPAAPSAQETMRLQGLLNKVGGLLDVDGRTGPNTRRAVSEARKLAGLPDGVEPDPALFAWLEAQPDPSPELPTPGVTFIAREEVGSRDYYESKTSQPVCPGGDSGVTIGVGYDLRFSADIFEADWGGRLRNDVLAALRPHLGLKGTPAAVAALSWIRIPWSTSWQVFVARSLPLQIARTRNAFPALPTLPGLCRSVLVSLVFNRGPALDEPGTDRRQEMRRIAEFLSTGQSKSVPAEILKMQRLWPDSSGLRERRKREADLWAEGLKQGQ